MRGLAGKARPFFLLPALFLLGCGAIVGPPSCPDFGS
ncbi:hypothetical protein F0726_01103 [Acidithiobacillus caldus]|nr:hypothetical protein F0726_01103 [Acidithiobacillus caldus]